MHAMMQDHLVHPRHFLIVRFLNTHFLIICCCQEHSSKCSMRSNMERSRERGRWGRTQDATGDVETQEPGCVLQQEPALRGTEVATSSSNAALAWARGRMLLTALLDATLVSY